MASLSPRREVLLQLFGACLSVAHIYICLHLLTFLPDKTFLLLEALMDMVKTLLSSKDIEDAMKHFKEEARKVDRGISIALE